MRPRGLHMLSGELNDNFRGLLEMFQSISMRFKTFEMCLRGLRTLSGKFRRRLMGVPEAFQSVSRRSITISDGF